VSTLTELIQLVGVGDRAARDELFSTAYAELRKLARARLRDGGRNTFLETTSLVHESYLRFLGAGELRLQDRRAFFAYSSKVMRSVVIDAVRERQALRHGGGQAEITLDTQAANGLTTGADEILKVNDALLSLEEISPRLAKVVEMRYFGGYSEEEIAEALDLTTRTVRRDWEKARMLLMDELRN
jgi:RNA polymerase sigma factor (TIGR02999 family)